MCNQNPINIIENLSMSNGETSLETSFILIKTFGSTIILRSCLAKCKSG